MQPRSADNHHTPNHYLSAKDHLHSTLIKDIQKLIIKDTGIHMHMDQFRVRRAGFSLGLLFPSNFRLAYTCYTSFLRSTSPKSCTWSNHAFGEGKILSVCERLLFSRVQFFSQIALNKIFSTCKFEKQGVLCIIF